MDCNQNTQLALFETTLKRRPRKKTIPIVSLHLVRERSVKYEPICRKQDVERIAGDMLKGSAVEQVIVIGLDSANRPTVISAVSGDVEQCVVYVRTIIKTVLLSNSISFIMAHNHPGGGSTPSEADWRIVGRLKQAAALLELTLLDSLIFDEDGHLLTSMAEASRWKS